MGKWVAESVSQERLPVFPPVRWLGPHSIPLCQNDTASRKFFRSLTHILAMSIKSLIHLPSTKKKADAKLSSTTIPISDDPQNSLPL